MTQRILYIGGYLAVVYQDIETYKYIVPIKMFSLVMLFLEKHSAAQINMTLSINFLINFCMSDI